MLDDTDDWDDPSTSWTWRALRIFRAYDVWGPLPDSPAPFLNYPDGYVLALTAWPADFSLESWREVHNALVALARELTA
ncbi:hypothetical protein ACFVAJ_11245 [Agromyces sp. NPDC057679]|uniref:hypothetical protein n=1 Tax=Agromyces sp. NPDC057679 TaxID=3346207 RepID=UPI00366D1AE7